MIYTTVEAIAARLAGRLQIGGEQIPFGVAKVSEDLLAQVLAQVEARINARIGQVYTLPLALSNPTAKALLASVAEKLVVAEVVPVHVAQGDSPVDNYGAEMRRQAESELSEILSGEIVLTGEAPVVAEQPTSTLTNQTIVARRKPLTDGRDDAYLVKW